MVPLSGFRVLDSGFRIPCSGNLDFGGLETQAKLIYNSYKNTSASGAVCLKREKKTQQSVGYSWEFLVI